MPIYYVIHPNLEIKATVDAPSTEKARTVFLDYLERQGKIAQAHLQEMPDYYTRLKKMEKGG